MDLTKFDLANAQPTEIDFVRNASTEIKVHKLILHFNSVVAIFVNSLAFYVILKYSTTQIGVYKWYLLNIVVSSYRFLISNGKINALWKKKCSKND